MESASLGRQALPAQMEKTVLMANQEPLAIQLEKDRVLRYPHPQKPNGASSAKRPNPDHLAIQDLKVQLVNPAFLDPLETMDLLVRWDRRDHQVRPEHQDRLERKDLMDLQAKPLLERDPWVHLDLPDLPVLLGLMDQSDRLAHQDQMDQLDLKENQERMDHQANQDPMARKDLMGQLAWPVPVIIVLHLVPLPDIKR